MNGMYVPTYRALGQIALESYFDPWGLFQSTAKKETEEENEDKPQEQQGKGSAVEKRPKKSKKK